VNQLPKIALVPLQHRDQDIVCLRFEYNAALHEYIKALENRRWSNTLRAWYVPNRVGLGQLLSSFFKDKAVLDFSLLVNEPAVLNLPAKRPETELTPLNSFQEQKVEAFSYWMRSRRYSENTVRTYVEALQIFLKYFQHKEFEDICNDDLVTFNNDYILKNKLSSSYQNQLVNAVKLFFRTVHKRAMDVELVHRPKRAKLLPNVLSKEEVKLILQALNNIKHKTMLSLIYACGLRCGELLRLKPEHVDEKRKLLIVKQSKGRKDRIVPFSDKIKVMLEEHLKIQGSAVYLFEGQVRGMMYDERSLQNVLKNAVTKAGVKKPVTLHWLRHSYATHLLESGTDLRYIQEILGHSSSRTTEIYTHVSNLSIQRIVSPFDNL